MATTSSFSPAVSHWFAEPGPLAPLPPELHAQSSGSSVSTSTWPFAVQPVPAPLAPIAEHPACSKAKRKATGPRGGAAKLEDVSLPADRAEQLAEPLGRCRAQVCGQRCAVPYALAQLDPSQADEDVELLVVELRSPSGEDGWLDDRTLTGVLHPHTETVYSLSALRRLVQARVALGGAGFRSRNLRRALYGVCEPDSRSRLLVTVVALADLQDLPLVSGECPPETSSG